jgi:hypothetical protein
LAIGAWAARQYKLLSPFLQNCVPERARGTRIQERIAKLRKIHFFPCYHVADTTAAELQQPPQQPPPPPLPPPGECGGATVAMDVAARPAALPRQQHEQQQQESIKRKSASAIDNPNKMNGNKNNKNDNLGAVVASVVGNKNMNTKTMMATLTNLPPPEQLQHGDAAAAAANHHCKHGTTAAMNSSAAAPRNHSHQHLSATATIGVNDHGSVGSHGDATRTAEVTNTNMKLSSLSSSSSSSLLVQSGDDDESASASSKQGRGCPKGSKNKAEVQSVANSADVFAAAMCAKNKPKVPRPWASSRDMIISVDGGDNDEESSSSTPPPLLADEHGDGICSDEWSDEDTVAGSSEDDNMTFDGQNDAAISALEKRLMASIGRDITRDEERDLMRRIDVDIALAERRQPMHQLHEDIAEGNISVARRGSAPVLSVEAQQCAAMIPNSARNDDFNSWMLKEKWTDDLQGSMILEKRSPEIAKLVPKVLISTHDLETQIVPQVIRDVDRPVVTFTALLEDVPKDPLSWILRVRGGDELFLLKFRNRVSEHLTKSFYKMNHTLLMEKGTEIEIVVACSTARIGATLEELSFDVDGRQELRLLLKKNETLPCAVPVLVDALAGGGVAVIIDGSAQVSKRQFKQLFDERRKEKSDFVFSIRAPMGRSALSLSPIIIGGHDSANEKTTPAAYIPTSKPPGTDEASDTEFDTPSVEESESDEPTDDADSSNEKRHNTTSPDSPASADEESPRSMMCYRHFHTKFLDTARIEFSSADMNMKHVLSSMWGQHKKKVQKSCDDKCRCVFMLPVLCQKVVADKIASTEKKAAAVWQNPLGLKTGDFPVGFLSHFSSQFLPKLEAQYPGETSHQTLKRLLHMWKTHERNAYFGQKCGAGCECIDHWETKTLFNFGMLETEHTDVNGASRGVSANDEQHRALPKDETTGKRKGVPQADDSIPQDHVPKKNKVDKGQQRRSSAEGEARIGPQPPASLVAVSGTSKRKASTTDLVSKKKRIHDGQQKRTSCDETTLFDAGFARGELGTSSTESTVRCEYEVKFSPATPMGYYFINELSDGRSQCTVHSVCPFIAPKRDARIQRGTTVRSAAIVSSGMQSDNASERKDIDTFTELKSLYEAASAEKKELQVWFINLRVDPEVSSELNNENWGYEKWKGARRNGWAGGSYENVLPRLAVPPRRNSQAKAATALPPTVTIPEALRAAETLQVALDGKSQTQAITSAISAINDEWVTINTPRPLRNDLQPRSALKTDDNKTPSRGSRKIRFNDRLEERRQYEKLGKTYEFEVRPSSTVSGLGAGRPLMLRETDTRERALSRAVENESLIDVVRLLENGAAADVDVDLQEMRDIITGKEGLGFKKIDIALKIGINAKAAVEASHALKNWVHFEIVIESIEEANFSGHAEADGLLLKLKGKSSTSALFL